MSILFLPSSSIHFSKKLFNFFSSIEYVPCYRLLLNFWSALIDVNFLVSLLLSNLSFSCCVFSGNTGAINLNPRTISHDSKDAKFAFVNWKINGDGGDDLGPSYPASQRHFHGHGLSHGTREGQMSVCTQGLSMGAIHIDRQKTHFSSQSEN